MSMALVFTHDNHQVLILPADVRLPDGVARVQVRAKGVDRIISPAGRSWDEFFLNGQPASEDFMVTSALQVQSDRTAI